MKVLLLGVGMQGKAALHDLVRSGEMEEIVVADWDFDALEAHVENEQYGNKVRCEPVNAANPDSINRLMEQSICYPRLLTTALPLPP